MTEKNLTPQNSAPSKQKREYTPTHQPTLSGAERRGMSDTYASRISGQHLAGSGALVFEGELLEFPQWGSRAA